MPSVAAHLRRATLFVLPSWQEGFGIAAAEALATGLPVVTTPSGGPEALVRDSGGGVVLEGFSAEELASTVRELLADPPRLERDAPARPRVRRARALSRTLPRAARRGLPELGWAGPMRFLITSLQTYESEFYGVVGRELERRGHSVVHLTESPRAAKELRSAASTRARSRT